MSKELDTPHEEDLQSLAYSERKAVFRLLAWLATRDERRDPAEVSFLEDLADLLALGDGDEYVVPTLDFLEEIESVDDLVEGVETEWVREMLIGQLLAIAWVDGTYDARERVGIRRICRAMGFSGDDFAAAEAEIVDALRKAEEEGELGPREGADSGSSGDVALAALAGGALLALTGGVAAPAVGGAIGSAMGLSGAAATSAGLAALGGGSLAAGGFGMAGGTAVVSGALGILGGTAAGRAMAKRTKDVDDVEIIDLDDDGAPVVLGVSGFLSENSNFHEDWEALREWAPEASVKALRWEAQANRDVYESFANAFGKHGAKKGIEFFAKQATKAAGKSLAWPTWFLQAIDLLGNPWAVARNLAEKTGRLLADALSDDCWGPRPVTLVGFSLGTRVIVEALESMDDDEIASSIERVILMGGAVGRDHVQWRRLADTVPGGFVNAYSTDDWVLGGLYRAAEWFEEPVGLGPLETDGVIDVDVTREAGGHLDYRENMSDVFDTINTALARGARTEVGTSGPELLECQQGSDASSVHLHQPETSYSHSNEEPSMGNRPGGEVDKLPLHFIWLADTSGSMSHDGKIKALNQSIREALPHAERTSEENPRGRLQMRAVSFGGSAEWYHAEPTDVHDYEWSDMHASGGTPMGEALRLVAEALDDSQMPRRALPPVLVLLSDGQPTDDFEAGLEELMNKPWGQKAVRIAISIGEDADKEVLSEFIGHPELEPLQANNPEALADQIEWVSTRVVQAASAPKSQQAGESMAGNIPAGQLQRDSDAVSDIGPGDVW